VIPNMSDDMLREVFDQLRSTAPKTVKIAAPQTRGSTVEITSVGCRGDKPVVNIVTVGKLDGAWIVAGSDWGPSWDPRISDHFTCQRQR
jgi:hypothetical protein